MSSQQIKSKNKFLEQSEIYNYKKNFYENDLIWKKNIEIILDQYKKELDQNKKELDQYKKELDQNKKELDQNKKELDQNKKELKQLKKILNDNKIEIETLKQNLEIKNKELINLKKVKGSQCSVEGNKYEKKIYNIIKNCKINNKLFNTQKEDDLAGSSSKIDIECNFNTEKDIGIEVKKFNTPDWMQCSIKYDKKNKSWIATNKGKNSIECRQMFNKLINDINLYNGEIPPFMKKSITHEEWIKIKLETDKWNDKYIDIPPDYISKLYKAKGCNYIQISDGYGLYHLGNDICNFDVPLFNVEQQLRIRTKIHTRKNKKGFCNLSVTISCQPKDITKINKSKYTLDDDNKLPVSLIYKS
jgi:hypothetical protein